MAVIVMTVPGTHLGHPAVVVFVRDPAQFLLDRSIHQHTLDLGLLGGSLDESDMLRRPGLRIEMFPVSGNEIAGLDFLALILAQDAIRHWHEPDVYVEAGLVSRVVRHRRSTARLRHVADQDAVPTRRFGGERGESFQEMDEAGMAPVTIA